jgi:hypothetical protein
MLLDRRVGRQCAIGTKLLPGRVERGLSRPDGVAGMRDFFVRHGPGHAGGKPAPQIVLCLREIRLTLRDIGAIFVIVDIQAMYLAHGLPQIGLRLLQCDLCIGRVDLDDRFALFHDLRVVGIHRDDGARDLRCDLYDVAVDVCIVGIHVETGVEEIIGAVRSACDCKGSDKQREQEFAFAGLFFRLFTGR